ncbi:cytochrome P450 monooxygenase [Lophiotrema nucula]|uniref:Cytochrome P450 monooxygenase n=1 Tax=Lophiotrema nucula TaxID=690887 RepID=A0A6A5ZMZ4_9PLEO|nr:cytochrome P450 monooxygenase [Lophiotrema nucula]
MGARMEIIDFETISVDTVGREAIHAIALGGLDYGDTLRAAIVKTGPFTSLILNHVGSVGGIQRFCITSQRQRTVDVRIFGAKVRFVEIQADIEKPLPGFPLVGLPEDGLSPKAAWTKSGFKVLAKGLREHTGAFQVMTGTGPKIIVPNRFAEEFRKHENANLCQTFGQDFFAGWRGFDGITFLTKHERTFSLGLVADAIVNEARVSIFNIFETPKEWLEIQLKDKIGELVARLSSRAFLGEELCRNPKWLQIAQKHTMDIVLWPIAYWLNPFTARLRRQIEKHKERVQQALAAGKKPEKGSDALGWMVMQAGGRDIDYAAGQLGMSVVGIHTTTEALSEAIVDLCNNPDLFEPLRSEIVEVVQKEGWSRAALYQMKLMDSFLKESQRMHPSSAVTVNRLLLGNIRLSDGTMLPKGARMFIAGRFFDPTLYPDPDKFDAYRFLQARSQDGQSNNWQHTSMTPEHLGFGYGDHGCPGRFFASAELKIALSFLLLHYDWQLPDLQDNLFMTFGVATILSPKCRVSFRVRRAEIEL